MNIANVSDTPRSASELIAPVRCEPAVTVGGSEGAPARGVPNVELRDPFACCRSQSVIVEDDEVLADARFGDASFGKK